MYEWCVCARDGDGGGGVGSGGGARSAGRKDLGGGGGLLGGLEIPHKGHGLVAADLVRNTLQHGQESLPPLVWAQLVEGGTNRVRTRDIRDRGGTATG